MDWNELRHALDTYFADIDDPTDEELAALEAELEGTMWDELAHDAIDDYHRGLTTSLEEVIRREGILADE